jgi:recombinational DNA repair protein (RecF pathway)
MADELTEGEEFELISFEEALMHFGVRLDSPHCIECHTTVVHRSQLLVLRDDRWLESGYKYCHRQCFIEGLRHRLAVKPDEHWEDFLVQLDTKPDRAALVVFSNHGEDCHVLWLGAVQ